MSTRRKRHGGNQQRAWENVNKTFGLTGLMESEAWYIALTKPDEAEEVLIEHFGSLSAAQRAYKALDEEVAQRFEVVAQHVFGPPEGPS